MCNKMTALDQDIDEFMRASVRAYGIYYPDAVKAICSYIEEANKRNKKVKRYIKCPACDGVGVFGQGSMVENKCIKCDGVGRIFNTKKGMKT